MERISRYFLVLVAIMTCAIVLPKVYWMAFDKPISTPFVLYSCTDNDFMVQYKTIKGMVREDTRGNNYTQKEYEQRLPLMYTRQLLVSGIMPDSINGVAMDMHELGRTKSNFRFKPEFMNAPQAELFPMFESESERATLEMPEDFFRINWRIEFIVAKTNQIDEVKSQLFSAALYKKGFDFPAKSISGLATTRKSCDEGYLITDSSDQMFHLKMLESKPFVRKIKLPEGLKFKFISCVDFKDKKYYAYLFSDKNEIYILTQDLYELIKLPVEGFNPETCELQIFGDIFHYNVIVKSDDHLKADVLNYSDYQKTSSFEKSWLKRSERQTGKIAAAIFPAQLNMSAKNSKFTNFYLERSSGFLWIIVNLVLAGIHLILLMKRKARLNKHIFDLSVVAITGIFGFIAVNFFQNKFFD